MQHPMQAHTGAYPAHNVTTELIQKYLDENKQLILAILDNQNLGKLNECAAYQAKLQANLMYLAAIADSQPPSIHAGQVPQPAVMQQPGMHYMAHQQTQQQIAGQQSFMAPRNPIPYFQQSYPTLHPTQQQQQTMQGQHAMNLSGMPPELVTGSGFPDFARANNAGGHTGVPGSRGLGLHEAGHGTPGGNGNPGSGHVDEGETSYLKASEEEGN